MHGENLKLIFFKILPVGAEKFNADRQTDRQTDGRTDTTKLTVALRKLANTPKK